MELDDINKWYADRIGKQVEELDEYDLFCASVVFAYAQEKGL